MIIYVYRIKQQEACGVHANMSIVVLMPATDEKLQLGTRNLI
jgi:hypothetical protein